MTSSAWQKCELNYNWWQFVCAIQTQPGKLNCLDCETCMCEPAKRIQVASVTVSFGQRHQ